MELEKLLKVLTGEELHYCLRNMLESVTSVLNEEISALECMGITSENSALDDIKWSLANEYKKLNLKKIKMLQSSLNYGKWLMLAYEKFHSDKTAWPKWVYITAGISESYARQLRLLAKMFGEYPRFYYLPITASDLYKIRKKVAHMLTKPEIADYWRDPAAPIPVLQPAAPEPMEID